MTAGEPSPISGPGVGVLAIADRNGVDESLHHGVAVAIDADGAIVASVGDVDTDIYPRSSLKPFQAAAMVAHGLDLPAPLLALAAASHSGEAVHLDGVREILSMHGLSVDDLQNTPTFPSGDDARAAAIASGIEPSSLQQNCSGKHAAMLATCVINGWPTSNYLDLDHPLQQAIVAELHTLGAEVVHVGIDGCGAPTHMISLTSTARAMGRLASTGSAVTSAMSANPMMVGGVGRDVTRWMEAVPGLAAKEGAQGVMVMAMPDGRAAAFKIADGSDAARAAVLVQGLRHLGVDVDGEHRATRDELVVDVLGHGRKVGVIRPVPWSDAPS